MIAVRMHNRTSAVLTHISVTLKDLLTHRSPLRPRNIQLSLPSIVCQEVLLVVFLPLAYVLSRYFIVLRRQGVGCVFFLLLLASGILLGSMSAS